MCIALVHTARFRFRTVQHPEDPLAPRESALCIEFLLWAAQDQESWAVHSWPLASRLRVVPWPVRREVRVSLLLSRRHESS